MIYIYSMKKLFNLLAATTIAAFVFTSCNKDSKYDYSFQEREIARLDSTNRAQAPILKSYALEHLGSESKLDTATGIWYVELETAQEENFNYINSGGYLNNFMAKVTYTGRKVPSGEIFDSTDEPKNFTSNGVISAWQFAFYPKTWEINGIVRTVGGLTEKGLNPGSKIRFIAPSTLCYDNIAMEKIAPNTPLDFTIEVIDLSL